MTFQAVPWPLMGRGEVRRGLTLLVSFVRMKTVSLDDLEVGRPNLEHNEVKRPNENFVFGNLEVWNLVDQSWETRAGRPNY